jgi:polygalacturonase
LLWGKTHNVVRDYGADNTGATYATVNIQNAINACGIGDTLLIPFGTFLLNNGLNLKSDMTVILTPKALLKANTDHVWLNNRSHIINGENLKNVTITGGGTIDGGGLVYPRGDYDRPRPGRGIRFYKSSNLKVQNLTVQNIPNFAVDFVYSSNINIDSLTVRGRGFFNLHGSSDGIDIESCTNVKITNCDVEVGDDGICIKSNAGYPCHNLRISKCVIASTCNAFKIGTSTVADVYDVIADNIIINKHSNPGSGNPVPTGDCISAIAMESNDNANVHDIICRNFTINSCYNPICFLLENRQGGTFTSRLENIVMENINCLKAVTQPIIFNLNCNIATNKIKNITLNNVIVKNYESEAGVNLKCMNGGYPEVNAYGIANAYGVWARGVDGLKLKNCEFYNLGGSKRQKFVFDSSVQNVDTSAITSRSQESKLNLPGKGLSQFDFFYAGESKEQNMYIVKNGQIVWEYKGPKDQGEISDAVLMTNGNILFAHQRGITLITPDKKVLWNYDAPKGCEIHTAQPIGKKYVLFIQNGDSGRVFIVNVKKNETVKSFTIPVKMPPSTHGQFRHARITAKGTLMVAHMDLGKISEYDSNGKELFTMIATGVWGVEPLKNGNILACCRSQIIEVTSKGEQVWNFQFKDIPEYNFNSPQVAIRRPNGNTIVGNWFNQWSGTGKVDPSNPPIQAIEITPDKKVVWALQSWTPPLDLGPSTIIQVLGDRGISEHVTFGKFK